MSAERHGIMRTTRGLLIAVVGILAPLAFGCGDSKPRRVAVCGHVTYRGKPLTTGTVSFTAAGNAAGGQLSRPATGEVQTDGSYSMRTFGQNDGALPGDYIVTVVALDYGHHVADDRGKRQPGEESVAVIASLIPKKYGSPQTSGFKATVPADAAGPLQFDFDLHD